MFNPYHVLSIGVNYSFSNTANYQSDNTNSYAQPHDLSTDVRYIGSLIHKEKHTLDLVVGFDYAYDLAKIGKPATSSYGYTSLSPLLELRYTMKDKLFVRAGSRYHFDQYRIFSANKPSSGSDYMVSGEIDYTPTKGHTLRASGLRDRICSDFGQREGYLASGDLSYIYQKFVGKNKDHYVNFTAEFKYDYVTLLNGNRYDVYAAKASVVWQYKAFCLSFNGQIFDNESLREEIEDYHLYYNLHVIPIFTLPKNWSISANLMYDSPLMSKTITEGDYFFASLRVSKQFGNWSIHAELSDPFHYQTTDKYYLYENHHQQGSMYGQKSYYLYHQYLNLGIMYKF